MEIKSWNDVFKAVVIEARQREDLPNLKEEDIQRIHNNLWNGIRYYLFNPVEAGTGILLNTFLTFYIREYYVEKKLNQDISESRKNLFKIIKSNGQKTKKKKGLLDDGSVL